MRKLFLLFTVLVATTALWAATQTVSYLYPVYNDGDVTKGIKEWKTGTATAAVVKNASSQVTLNAGWYVVTDADVQLAKGAICKGAVNLILADGAKLTARGSESVVYHDRNTPGIQVSGEGNSLTIYGQSAQSGQLIALGTDYAAGIGGGYGGSGSNITINGGVVTANGGDCAAGIGGGNGRSGSDITINGGSVTAKGGDDAAGIGGGEGSSGSDITINGGVVTATGGQYGAGIGGGEGSSGSDITINGGVVTATGGQYGAGIGGGVGGSGSDITINGGVVTAIGGQYGAGIGGGGQGAGLNITIIGGIITAIGGENGAGIGSGFMGDAPSNIKVATTLIVKADQTNPPTTVIPNTGGDLASKLAEKQYVKIKPTDPDVAYIAPVYNDAADPSKGILKWDTLTCNDYTIVTNTSEQVTWNAGWYVVTGADVQLAYGAICKGAVHLILADGAKLTAIGIPGIQVSGNGNSLTIYGQTAQTGQLIANGGDYGAGIGGGYDAVGSNITINGGVVTANGGHGGAGIGGGYEGSGFNITINGGEVTATGGEKGAGIGGGEEGSGSDITINGGVVAANGGNLGAGIGGGNNYGNGFDITINGGVVAANGGYLGAGIGGGRLGAGSNIVVATSLLVKADNTNPPLTEMENDGGDLASKLVGKQYVTIEPLPAVSYMAPVYNDVANPSKGILKWDTLTCNDYTIVTSSSEQITWNAGWYAVTGADVQLAKGAVCNGAVHLILVDGAKLTATGNPGIQVSGSGNSLTIYGQSAQTGQLIATGGRYTAGIGGGDGEPGTNVTINGGTITANGGDCAAGIGGGYEGSGPNITINGGEVTANGGRYAAGIGGGYGGSGSNITINGGVVTANGGDCAAGIGGGNGRSGSDITINGGSVTAKGGDDAAGIGGGQNADGSNITINGGVVTATGGNLGAGIGGGSGYTGSAPQGGHGSNIIINNGTVTAVGGTYGAGIGGGSNASGSNITINGGVVTANGGHAAGIGSGDEGTDATNIFVTASLVIRADVTNPPVKVVAKNRESTTDIASELANKQYVTITEATVKGNLTAEDFTVGNTTATYDGEAKAATVEFIDGIIGAGDITVTYKQGEEEVTPLNAGEYDIYVSVTEGDNYNALGATKVGTLTIAKATLTAEDFIYTAPENLIWDGNGKSATVTFDDQEGKLTGYGSVTVKYNGQSEAPVDAGDYTVSIDVTEGDNYNAATSLTSAKWKFTIQAIPISVSYIDKEGVSRTTKAWEVKNSAEQVTWEAGWYVVTGTDIRLLKGAVCDGAVHLILADGAQLTATGGEDQAGIRVSGESNSLTIYAQAAQTGQLIAKGGDDAAGIGGGRQGAGLNITIIGGIITAIGGDNCAGIGSGYNAETSSNIFVATTLKVKADNTNPPTTVIPNTGGDLASKLAEKQYATVEPKGNLTAGDFTVSNTTATYDGEAKSATVEFADGITGAGELTVTYKQGEEEVTPLNAGVYDICVSVTEGDNYNALGATKVGTLTIAKATLTAGDFIYTAPENLIWDGNGKSATVTFDDQEGKLTGYGSVTVKYNGQTEAPVDAGDYTVSIDVTEGDNYNAATALSSAKWKFTIQAIPISVSYIDKEGVSRTTKAWEVKNSAEQVTWEAGWYVVTGTDIQLHKGAVCNGEVHLILADGAQLTATGGSNQAGVRVSGEGNSLTIYGQSAQSGQLIAKGGQYGAGIGGGNHSVGSNITINGGVVTANGGGSASGIGGGNGYSTHAGSGSNITVNNGTVTATGGQYGAGIGGGNQCSGSDITINGGEVTANGGQNGAGIGGGNYYGNGSNITINGGVVRANGGYLGSGIGGGRLGAGSNIKMATSLLVKADNTNPPTTVVANDGGDLASKLAGKQYATVGPKGNLTVMDFVVSNTTATYDGEAKAATVELADGITGAGEITVTYKQGDEEVTPLNAGEYDIYVSVTEGDNYNAATNLTDESWTFTIAKATLTAEDFVISNTTATYDGEAKAATVELVDGITGAGEITVTYKQGDEEVTPLNAGEYDIYVSVTEGDNYNAATNLTDESWIFTIQEPTDLIDVNDNSKFEIQNSKLIKNGHLYILRDNNLYNATGARVK